ncbi:MAG: hypothetical protein NTV17_08380 [Burkholderiales bacterium]|jgi:hypothetical protein|nr:hypothetical protein [Burkholderiales bacterium]
MGSFSIAFLETLVSIGVQPDRARSLVEMFDRSVDERYGLHAQIIATKRDVAELETRLARDIAALDNKLVQGLAECNGRIAESNGRIAECNSRIAEAKVDLVKWLLGALTAQTALIAGIVKLF